MIKEAIPLNPTCAFDSKLVILQFAVPAVLRWASAYCSNIIGIEHLLHEVITQNRAATHERSQLVIHGICILFNSDRKPSLRALGPSFHANRKAGKLR